MLRNWLTETKPKVRGNEKKTSGEENIQQKYADKIEDADFEELE